MHEVLHLLQHRRSCKQFGERAPNAEQLENMFKAALRAPDHGKMQPYYFVVIEKAQMEKFHTLLTSAAVEFNLEEKIIQKAEKLSRQAPMVIGVVARIDHSSPKVPAWEQMLTAGCAAYALQLAAHTQGFDTFWFTKHWVEGAALREAFGCQAGDKIVGLIMIGEPADNGEPSLARSTENSDGFVRYLK